MNPASPHKLAPPVYLTPKQVARKLGVKPGTVYKWVYRDVIPPQDLPGLWLWNTIYRWARQTGRL